MSKSQDTAVNRYNYLNTLYKQRNNEEFVRKNIFLMENALVYVFEYLNSIRVKASKVYEICGFPIVRYDKDNQVNLVLVLPMLNGQYASGIKNGIRTDIDLDELTDKYLAMIKRLNARGFMVIVDYHQKSDTELVESVMSPFGRLYLPRGAQMTELKFRDIEDKEELNR